MKIETTMMLMMMVIKSTIECQKGSGNKRENEAAGEVGEEQGRGKSVYLRSHFGPATTIVHSIGCYYPYSTMISNRNVFQLGGNWSKAD